MTLLVALVSLAAAAVSATSWFRLERERAVSAATLAALEERIRELSMRVDVVEHDAVAASAHAEVAESVLLEKGYADADDLEAARRRLESDGAPGARGDEMH
jgi:NAD-specific glutamate dehydrogenase